MAEKEVQINKGGAKKTPVTAKAPNIPQGNAALVLTSSSNKVSMAAKPSTSGKAASKQAPAGRVTTEVLNILREMNAILNSQKERLESQEQRIDTLTEQFSYQPDYTGYEYEHDSEYSCDDNNIEQDSNSEQGTEKQMGSVFKCPKSKYQQIEPVDSEINEDLAQFVNSSFKNGLSDDKKSELLKDIHRPHNCESLVKTRVNQDIWRLLKSGTQYDDNQMQTVQELIVKATYNLVKFTDKRVEKFEEENMNWSTNAIALLGHANKLINVHRKETHRSDLDPKYHYLASPSIPYTEYLYGEDTDVNKNIKEIHDLNKLGRSLGRGYSYPRGSLRGFPGFRRPHPYSLGVRGRGGKSLFLH